jgi:hypothetical protein
LLLGTRGQPPTRADCEGSAALARLQCHALWRRRAPPPPNRPRPNRAGDAAPAPRARRNGSARRGDAIRRAGGCLDGTGRCYWVEAVRLRQLEAGLRAVVDPVMRGRSLAKRFERRLAPRREIPTSIAAEKQLAGGLGLAISGGSCPLCRCPSGAGVGRSVSATDSKRQPRGGAGGQKRGLGPWLDGDRRIHAIAFDRAECARIHKEYIRAPVEHACRAARLQDHARARRDGPDNVQGRRERRCRALRRACRPRRPPSATPD